MAEHPQVFVLAGPNGAGKTTCAGVLLPETLHQKHFVNADTIAAGLSAFDPASVALEAGRIMRERLRALAAARADFAFESTLSGRSLAPFLRHLREDGYRVRLLYLWLRHVELSVSAWRSGCAAAVTISRSPRSAGATCAGCGTSGTCTSAG